MRGLLAPAVVHVALLAAGLGILRATGVVRQLSIGNALAASGLAYLVGVAVVMQACVLLLVLGAPFGIPLVAVLCLACAAPIGFDVRSAIRERLDRAAIARIRNSEQIALITLGAFAVVALAGIVMLGNVPIGDYDAWNLWTRKAGLMFFGSHLPLAVLQSPASGYIHPDYPLVLSLLEALHLRALDRYELSSVHTVMWILGIAYVWAGAFLANRVTRPIVWAPILVGIFMLATPELLSAYADVPVGFYLGLGVFSLGIWLESGRRSDLVVAALLLAGAAGIKNEGLMGAVSAFIVALVVITATERWGRRLQDLLIAALGVGLFAVLPWRLWLAAHSLKGDLPIGKGLDPAFLAHRLSRVWPAVQALYGQIDVLGGLAVVVPISLAVVLLALRERAQRRSAVFYFATGVAYFVALVWAYWVSPLEIHFHISTSVNRVYVGIAFIAVAAILQIAGGSFGSARWRSSPVLGDAAPELELKRPMVSR